MPRDSETIRTILEEMRAVYPLTKDVTIKGWKFDCVEYVVYEPGGMKLEYSEVKSFEAKKLVPLWEKAVPSYAEAAYLLTTGLPEVMLAHIASSLKELETPWTSIREVKNHTFTLTQNLARRMVNEVQLKPNDYASIQARFSFGHENLGLQLENRGNQRLAFNLSISEYYMEVMLNIRKVLKAVDGMIQAYKLITEGGENEA